MGLRYCEEYEAKRRRGQRVPGGGDIRVVPKTVTELVKGAEVGAEGRNHIGREQQPPCLMWGGGTGRVQAAVLELRREGVTEGGHLDLHTVGLCLDSSRKGCSGPRLSSAPWQLRRGTNPREHEEL